MNIDITSQETSVIAVGLRRTKEGIRVDVKVDPSVEAFFQHWGGDLRVDVGQLGRMWLPLQGRNAPLQVWHVMPSIGAGDGGGFDLFQVGQPLSSSLGLGGTNISFLRLVGASSAEGAAFVIADVISRDGLSQLAEGLRRAAGRFYEQFLKPAAVQVDVYTSVSGV